MSIKAWSNSGLSTLLRCGEQFRRRYIEKERKPPSPRMVRGSAVHKVAQETHRRMRDHLRLVPGAAESDAPIVAMTPAEAADLARDEVERRITEGVRFETPEPKREEAEATDFAVATAGFYVTKVAPKLRPVMVERFVKVTPKDSDISINGKIDLVEQVPEMLGGGKRIRDLKTKAKAPAAREAEDSGQLTMYGLLFQAEFGAMPQELVLDHVVRTPTTKKISHKVQITHRDQGDVRVLVNRLNKGIEAVEAGVFVPNTSGWWCAPKWCEYWSTCPYVANHR